MVEASESSSRGVSCSLAPTSWAPGGQRHIACTQLSVQVRGKGKPEGGGCLFEPVFTKPLWSTVKFTRGHGGVGLPGAGVHLPAFSPRRGELG